MRLFVLFTWRLVGSILSEDRPQIPDACAALVIVIRFDPNAKVNCTRRDSRTAVAFPPHHVYVIAVLYGRE